MSTQAQFNLEPFKYILYYCNVVNSDPTVYNVDLSSVCLLIYDPSDNIQILTWLIGAYSQPTIPTLLSYPYATVTTFYNNFYNNPTVVTRTQPFKITTSDLSAMRVNSTMIGYYVYDLTSQSIKYYNGSAWVDNASQLSNYVLKAGDTMTGTLNSRALIPSANNSYDLGSSSNKFKDLYLSGTLSQALPSCISIWSSDNVSVAFSANVVRLIPITNFSQTINPKNDFTFTASSGRIMYTGAISKYFRVTIQYSYNALALASTLTNYISKNGSLTINGARTVVTFLLLGQSSAFNSTISDVVLLDNGDTIQLGGQLTTTNSVSIQSVAYSINQI